MYYRSRLSVVNMRKFFKGVYASLWTQNIGNKQFSAIFSYMLWHIVVLVVQVPARGSTQVLLCLFPGVLWLWHFLYSVSPHPVSSLHIYTFVVPRAFMAGAASQAGEADSSWAPGLTSGLQGSVNVHRGALLLEPQWQCISSFVFYILTWNFAFDFEFKFECRHFASIF